MTANEYFGDWIDVIDKEELRKVVTWVNKVNSADLCPSPKNIFRAFRACSFKDCKVVFLGQAGLFKNDIVNSLKTIEVYHPAYYARTGKKMPSSVFTDINQALKQQYNYQIEFYKETEYGTC